jgi:UDP-glucose 6-dehydrogenase
MKPSLLVILLSAVLVNSPIAIAESKNPEYIVKSFKRLGDDVLSEELTAFSQKHNLTVVSCDVDKAELICVFQKR